MNTIYNNVKVTFGFKDRIRILFGKVVHVDTAINVHDDEVLNSQTSTMVEKIFPSNYKNYGYGEVEG